MLHSIAWAVVIALFAFAVSCLWVAWRLWRQERLEQTETGWRLRRSLRVFRRPSTAARHRPGE